LLLGPLVSTDVAADGEQSASRSPAAALRFTDVTATAGVGYLHAYSTGSVDNVTRVGGGVGSGDYDGDGWVDLYGVTGASGGNVLFRNQRDGTFAAVAGAAGAALPERNSSGPTFADYDGDGDLDLYVGVIGGARPTLFRNDGQAGFVAYPEATESFSIAPHNSASFGDYDGDRDLDLFVTHWGTLLFNQSIEHLWRNEGNGTFAPATAAAGLQINAVELPPFRIPFSFSANFSDIDNDGWSDLLLASDFENSQVFINNRDGTFRETTDEVISDENGMGTAVGDYDNDGDLDWFVSSIFDPSGIPRQEWGATGNRLYRNRGDGSFEDATEAAGVRDGNWGWGSCFADFDNDGFLDIFHVNGWDLDPMFVDQPVRLFVSNRDGTFREQAEAAGVADRGDGRGVVCFDYDRDGDIDVFISNNNGSARLFRNDTGNQAGFLNVRLIGRPPNTQGIGARVYVTSEGMTQMRELRAGCNYVSQDPSEAHFGLGAATVVSELRIRWPDGTETVRSDISAGRFLWIPEDPGDANCDGRVGAADIVRAIALDRRDVADIRCALADVDEDGLVDDVDRQRLLALAFGR
jgi:hypothetical protein